jgi:membrane protease YdiL (CAAX protease family)
VRVLIVSAVLTGMFVMLIGTVPRNILFAMNLRHYPSIPWSVPVVALYLWIFWRYLRGSGPPKSTYEHRRAGLRAYHVSARVWRWALLAGGLSIFALVLSLRIANRLVVLPEQKLPDLLAHVPGATVLALLLMAAPVAGVVEEAAFRGYMQGPIERRFGPGTAILITGTMFAVSHLDFTPMLWPYYLAVSAIYGTVTYLTRSILPAVVLHTGGNVYSNFDLWLRGQAEWQASSSPQGLIWATGPDATFVSLVGALLLLSAFATWSYVQLARSTRIRASAPL